MELRRLIDGVVKEFATLLVALAIRGGRRESLAGIDHVFFEALARELEARGVPRKVAADMLGLGLRSYQKKLQRIKTQTESGPSLWQRITAFVAEREVCSRGDISDVFVHEDPAVLASVLADLVSTGLLAARDVGGSMRYEVTRGLAAPVDEETADVLVWGELFRRASTTDELEDRLPLPPPEIRNALGRLEAAHHVRCHHDGVYVSDRLHIQQGQGEGWTEAVYDHIRCVTSALVTKLTGKPSSARASGLTFSFDLHADHPLRAELVERLSDVRTELKGLWQRVAGYNERERTRQVVFSEKLEVYLGENLRANHEA